MAQLVECLSAMWEVLCSIPTLHISDMVASTCNPSTYEVEWRRGEVQGPRWLCREFEVFEVRLDYK